MTELLEIKPEELQFPFELRKRISCSMQLINKSQNYVAFKVMNTNPKNYLVRPSTGVVLPRSTADVLVTMLAQREAPPDMQCRDKFLVQCVVANEGTSVTDIPPNLFNKVEGHHVEESKLRVVYVPPPHQPPSPPVRVSSVKGSSPRASVSDKGTVNPSEHTKNWPLIYKAGRERHLAIWHRNKVQRELETLRRQIKANGGGIPLLYVIIVGVVSILLGYLFGDRLSGCCKFLLEYRG